MSSIKFNNDKETAIEFHQVAKSLDKKFHPQLEEIYIKEMQTAEGKQFITSYLNHKKNPLSFNEKAVITKSLKEIEESRPKWKNNFANKAAASKFVEQSVSDDVKAMVSNKPHPQLLQEEYKFKHFSATISTQLSISKEKEQSLSTTLTNMMTNLKENHDFDKEKLESIMKEPVFDKSVSKSVEITKETELTK